MPIKDPVKRAKWQAAYYQRNKVQLGEKQKKRYWKKKCADANFAAELHLKDITIKDWWDENGGT